MLGADFSTLDGRLYTTDDEIDDADEEGRAHGMAGTMGGGGARAGGSGEGSGAFVKIIQRFVREYQSLVDTPTHSPHPHLKIGDHLSQHT